MKPPARSFQFFPLDWRASRRVQQLTFEQRGMYFELLLECWLHGGVPDSPTDIAERVGGTEQRWKTVLPTLKTFFKTRKRDGWLVNEKIQCLRREAENFRKQQAASGLRGANQRWHRHRSAKDGDGGPIGFDGSVQIRTSTDPIRTDPIRTTSPSPSMPTARSKRPIFAGQRLVVFEWQLDDLRRLLGPHTDAFDLHEWFAALDAQSVVSDQVIPQRDNGAWLQEQTLAEARRRGLPVASTTANVVGKQTQRLAAAVANIRRGDGKPQ